MFEGESEGNIEVVLFERGELPPPAQKRAGTVCERLESLAEAGHIDEVSREEWVKRAPLADCATDLRDTYLSFTSWADRAGVSLNPFFQIRRCFSPEEGERTDWLVMPAFCLAVYDGDELAAVYPHSEDGDARTVEDGLSALVGERSESAGAPSVAD